MNGECTDTAGQLVNRVSRAFARTADNDLRELGLSFSQLPVLAALRDGGALSQTQLTQIANVEQPSMAQMLTRIERDGLIKRTPDPADARSRLISLTAMVLSRLPEARRMLGTLNRDMVAGFTKSEVTMLYTLLRRVNGSLGADGSGRKSGSETGSDNR